MEYERPEHTVVIITKDGTRYYVKEMGQSASNVNIVTGLTLTESEGQLAQKVTLKLINERIEGQKGGYPDSLFSVKSRVFVYAKGVGITKGEEVFRGLVWENKYANGQKKEVVLTCYDNLIYFMNSEISMFFSKGKKTKSIMNTICKKWGIKLKYSYYSITHPKLPLSGTLADVFTSDILDKVKKKKGTKYVIRSSKDVMTVLAEGKNQTVYIIDQGGGPEIEYTRTTTMEGMITKVVITGKTNKKGKTKIAATVKKNTKTYGTLQKVIHKDEDTKLKQVKSEAKSMLKEHAQPKTSYEIQVLDIPWIRKGDKIGVCYSPGKVTYGIVSAVTHDVMEGTMNIEIGN